MDPSRAELLAQFCASPYQIYSAGSISLFLMRWVFPLQFLIGVGGNCLNLLVLFSRTMRTRQNLLFASLAFVDLGFLLAMAPAAVAAVPGLQHDETFYHFYQLTKRHFVAIANWLSTASIWIALALTAERYWLFRCPLLYKANIASIRLRHLIPSLVGGSLLVTCYRHWAYNTRVGRPCANGTDPGRLYIVAAPVHSQLVHALTIVNIYVIVLFPLLALVVLNALLLRALRRSNASWRDGQPRNSTRIRQRNERHVTRVVVLTVACFTLANVPSAAAAAVLTARAGRWSERVVVLTALANSLVVFGKMANFFLFCTSANFRELLGLKLRDPLGRQGNLRAASVRRRRRRFSNRMRGHQQAANGHQQGEVDGLDDLAFHYGRRRMIGSTDSEDSLWTAVTRLSSTATDPLNSPAAISLAFAFDESTRNSLSNDLLTVSGCPPTLDTAGLVHN